MVKTRLGPFWTIRCWCWLNLKRRRPGSTAVWGEVMKELSPGRASLITFRRQHSELGRGETEYFSKLSQTEAVRRKDSHWAFFEFLDAPELPEWVKIITFKSKGCPAYPHSRISQGSAQLFISVCTAGYDISAFSLRNAVTEQSDSSHAGSREFCLSV